jgi:outer membrane murein-binding lipoprotein Lpp
LLVLVIAVAGGSVALAGCSSGPPSASVTKPAGSTSAPSTASSSSTTPATQNPATENLTVTAAVSAALLQAGAALNGLQASDYTGLVPGATYYAYDATTATYWAGAALVPSSSSMRAQVSVQDDGGYLLFSRPANGAWRVWDVGLAGTEGSVCPVAVSSTILALWHWAPGTCRAPNS